MKKVLLLALPLMLTGCSYYNTFVERMHTDKLQYQCDEKPLTVELNRDRQQVSFIYKNDLVTLKQGMSASGTRYSDGIHVFWSKGDTANVYYQDHVVLNNCKLQTAQR